MTTFAYLPALHGGMFFDDDLHVTAPQLSSWHGLGRIWFEPGATQQYYPLLHTAFWIENRLWGGALIGYHGTNVVLHVICASLLAAILRKLSIRGPWLAAGIFALHPVAVESVAWISQQKNTLSTAFYFAAALAYLRFDHEREPRRYLYATLLFTSALLSKSATVTLPAALLVVAWWRHGRLSWHRDAKPLLPWFGLSLGIGLITTHVEGMLLGTEGEAWAVAFPDRLILAGRAIWFYLSKLLWPQNLIFCYPRWDLQSGGPLRFLWPIGVAVVFVAFWLLRHHTRTPLAAALLYVGTLVPTLGVFGLYYFRYSFVADHFQYLAMPSLIALAASSVATLSARYQRWVVPAVGTAVLLALGGLTLSQAGTYRDAETLYRTTTQRNPSCWMAYNNLGGVLLDAGRAKEAVGPLESAVAFKPASSEPRLNLAAALAMTGRRTEAVEQYREALRVNPESAGARNNLANELRSMGRTQEAIELLQQSLRIRPGFAKAETSLGAALADLGRWGDAIPHFEAALSSDPGLAEAEYNLAVALSRVDHRDEALHHYELALRLRPAFPDAEKQMGMLLVEMGRGEEAAFHLERAAKLQPGSAEIEGTLGVALAATGRSEAALEHLQESVRLEPDNATVQFNLGNLLTDMRRPGEAVAHFRRAARLQPESPIMHRGLGVALLRAGDAGAAVDEFQAMVRLSPDNPDYRCDLGAALAAGGRMRQAEASLREALRLRPGHERASALLAKISNE